MPPKIHFLQYLATRLNQYRTTKFNPRLSLISLRVRYASHVIVKMKLPSTKLENTSLRFGKYFHTKKEISHCLSLLSVQCKR